MARDGGGAPGGSGGARFALADQVYELSSKLGALRQRSAANVDALRAAAQVIVVMVAKYGISVIMMDQRKRPRVLCRLLAPPIACIVVAYFCLFVFLRRTARQGKARHRTAARACVRGWPRMLRRRRGAVWVPL